MYTCIYVLGIISYVSSVTGISLIHPQFNPGCQGCMPNETVFLYIKAEDNTFDHVLHQVWDFTGHVPTILYVIGDKNSTLDVEWNDKNPTQIITSGNFYSFAMILNNVIEYNDTDGNDAKFNYKYPHREISLRDVTWRLQSSTLSNHEAKVRVRGALDWQRHKLNGTIDINLQMSASKGRSFYMPRLQHSVNSTQVDVSLIKLSVSPRYTAARFALRYVVVSEDKATDALRYSEEKTIDDEYTPGVFETMNWMTPASPHRPGGYLQYRPIAYTTRRRNIETSIDAFVGNYNKTKIPRGCLVEKYYADVDRENLLVNEIIASFGQTSDGYYVGSNYTAWTYSLGYGTPPTESPSIFVILMLSLSVITPIVACSCSYLIGKMLVRRSSRELIFEREEDEEA